MTTQRRHTAAAALVQVGEHGLHGLTHRKVDARAGVPAGTTSNYFRTRSALIAGVLEHLEELDREAWEHASATPRPRSRGELTAALVAFVDDAIGPRRTHTTARFALFAAAAADPELATRLGAIRARIVEWAESVLIHISTEDTASCARALCHYLDGLILHKIATATSSSTLSHTDSVDIGVAVDRITAGRTRS